MVHTDWAQTYIVNPFMNKPLVWFTLSLCVWVGVAFAVYYLVRQINDKSAGEISYRIKVNKPLNLDALDEYLAFKSIIGEDGVADGDVTLQRVRWQEEDVTRWEGYLPVVELLYDVKHGYLLDVHLTIRQGVKMYSYELNKPLNGQKVNDSARCKAQKTCRKIRSKA